MEERQVATKKNQAEKDKLRHDKKSGAIHTSPVHAADM